MNESITLNILFQDGTTYARTHPSDNDCFLRLQGGCTKPLIRPTEAAVTETVPSSHMTMAPGLPVSSTSCQFGGNVGSPESPGVQRQEREEADKSKNSLGLMKPGFGSLCSGAGHWGLWLPDSQTQWYGWTWAQASQTAWLGIQVHCLTSTFLGCVF